MPPNQKRVENARPEVTKSAKQSAERTSKSEHNNVGKPSGVAGVVHAFTDGVFRPLAGAVPPSLAAIALISLFAIYLVPDQSKAAVAYVAIPVVAGVSLLYISFARTRGRKAERRAREAEDEAEAKSKILQAVQQTPLPENTVWSRLQVRLELPQLAIDSLREVLKDVHFHSFGWLSGEHVPGAEMTKVRVNVMLPDNRRAEYGVISELFIPKRLHVNMEIAPDREVRFSLTQGLVGRVYSENKPGIAVSEGGAWRRIHIGDTPAKLPGEPDFELTEWQRKLIHPDLRWVVSIPLQYSETDGTSRAFGVLNIDGIGFEVTEALLLRFVAFIAPKGLVVSASLGELVKERITIIRQEISNG